jgi:hypothetical protein
MENAFECQDANSTKIWQLPTQAVQESNAVTQVKAWFFR